MTRTVLIVDDSKTIRDMLRHTLSREGFEVTDAYDGVDALAVKKETTFDLIITDINMPNMGGIELIKKLREDTNNRATPILVLSTESGADLKREAKRAGATGWVVKPFIPEKLINAINKVCH